MEGIMTGIIGLLFYSAIALASVMAGVFIAGRFFPRRDCHIAFIPLAIVIGFLAGGAVGWAFVPAQWTASFWTTVEAAGDSLKYGEPFEHTAERVLLYFLYPAVLGAAAFGAAALVVTRRVPGPHSARP
jgi:hypothetical protein